MSTIPTTHEAPERDTDQPGSLSQEETARLVSALLDATVLRSRYSGRSSTGQMAIPLYAEEFVQLVPVLTSRRGL